MGGASRTTRNVLPPKNLMNVPVSAAPPPATLRGLPHQTAWDIAIPRIFVECTQATREGHEYGCWIDAISNAEMQVNIKYILDNAPIANARLFKFTATMNFAGVSISSEMTMEYIAQLGLGILKYGRAFALYHEFYEHRQLENIFQLFEEDFKGVHPSTEHFVRETVLKQGLLEPLENCNLNLRHLSLGTIIRDWFNSEQKVYHRVLDDGLVYVYRYRFV